MSQFNYSDYQTVVARAQTPSNTAVKVGFFKLKGDGDEALIRFNVASLDELQFATVHQLGAAQKWMKISCLNPVGSYADTCPLCAKVAAGDTSIGKASKKVYVQLLVSYKDAATGQFSAAIPVIWERPAGFSKEIASLLRDYGNLKEHVLKVTRVGAAGSKDTKYTINYIPLYDKAETVPTDFSAFDNFKINKHSYWEKTIEEIETFLTTGAFPEVESKPTAGANDAAKATLEAAGGDTAVEQALGMTPETTKETPAPEATTTTTSAETGERPARNFNFNF